MESVKGWLNFGGRAGQKRKVDSRVGGYGSKKVDSQVGGQSGGIGQSSGWKVGWVDSGKGGQSSGWTFNLISRVTSLGFVTGGLVDLIENIY